MDRGKARYLITDFMHGLWPKWNFTWIQQEEWTSLLQEYTDDDARAAIRLVFKEGRSSAQPFPNEFMKYVREITEAKPVTPSQSNLYPELRATLWLICVERGLRFASPGFLVYCVEGTTKAQAEREAVLTANSAAGGKWVVFEGPIYEARKRAKQIKEESRAEAITSNKAAVGSELRPLEDIMPDAYQPEQESDKAVAVEHDPNKLMNEDSKDSIPY